MEINPKIFGYLALFGIAFLLLMGTPYLFPHKEIQKINKTNISPNITYIYVDRTVLVTPTPDGHIYFAGEYQNGTRLLQRPFSFIRYNALGKQDMKVTTIVYNYMQFETLHWFNPTTYKYQEQTPENPNNKFLLVFVYVFMDDIIGDDTRMWAFSRNAFAVDDGLTLYRPLEYPYQIRYKEVENTVTFNKDVKVQAFKSLREYSSGADMVKSAGEYNDEIYYLRGGVSNAIDGFLIFEIPKNDNVEQLRVLGQFYVFGNSQWVLRN